jgi:hypothetical protein
MKGNPADGSFLYTNAWKENEHFPFREIFKPFFPKMQILI